MIPIAVECSSILALAPLQVLQAPFQDIMAEIIRLALAHGMHFIAITSNIFVANFNYRERETILKRNRGFNLLNLLVTLAIVAILVAIGITSYQGIHEDSKAEEREWTSEPVLISYGAGSLR